MIKGARETHFSNRDEYTELLENQNKNFATKAG